MAQFERLSEKGHLSIDATTGTQLAEAFDQRGATAIAAHIRALVLLGDSGNTGLIAELDRTVEEDLVTRRRSVHAGALLKAGTACSGQALARLPVHA
jgi:hypothetical protein